MKGSSGDKNFGMGTEKNGRLRGKKMECGGAGRGKGKRLMWGVGGCFRESSGEGVERMEVMVVTHVLKR